MFTTNFVRQVLEPIAVGQLSWVGAPIDFFVKIVAAHPAPLNAGFVLNQLALGVGFLFPCLVRPAIVGSVAWSAVLWLFSEGFGCLAGWQTSMVTGAPALYSLYAVLALAVWPAPCRCNPSGPPKDRVAGWLPAAWVTLWVGGCRGDSGDLHNSAAAALGHCGNAPFVVLVTVMALVGLAGLTGWR